MNIKFTWLFIFFYFLNVGGAAVNYPTSGFDRILNTLRASGDTQFQLNAGDTVGWTGSAVGNGLCWFPGGIETNGGGTGTVEFATPLPVQRYLDLSVLNVLNLRANLMLGGRIDLLNNGYIQGGTNRICLSGPLYLGVYWISATGNYSIRFSGCNNTIFFNEGGSIKQPNSSYELEFRNTVLNGIGQDSLVAAGNLILYDSIIRLDSDYCFNSLGSLLIYGDVFITGTHSFCLDAECSIRDDSKLIFDIGTTFSMGTHGSISFESTKSGIIYFNGSSILVGDKDFDVDSGKIIFENEVTIDDEGNYGKFIVRENTEVDVLGNARVVLENTTTFSIL
jgi:hypothetical protein